MKTNRSFLRIAALSLLASTLPAKAVLFTNDTVISPENNSFDGDDLALSNCTVTVDGPHNFASVHVLSGGVLTHSFATNGLLPDRHVLGELQVLNGTLPIRLNYPNVLTNTLVVSDFSSSVVYTQGVDYISIPISQGFYSIERSPASAIPD